MFINRGWNGAKSEACLVFFEHGRYVNIHCTEGDLGNKSKSYDSYLDRGWKEVKLDDFWDRMDDAKGEYRNLLLEKLHVLYWMLRKSYHSAIMDFYNGFFANVLSENIRKERGITYMNRTNPNFEYMIDYAMIDFEIKDDAEIELRVINMYGRKQWIHLEEAKVRL